MVRMCCQIGIWELDCWYSTEVDVVTEDDWLIDPRGSGCMRLAVVDGVTGTASTPQGRPVDVQAAYAAGEVRTALRSRQPIEACLHDANTSLHSRMPSSRVLRDIPQATVVAADLSDDLGMQLVQGGDCMAWFRSEETWVEAFPGDVHTVEYRELADAAYSHATSLEDHLEISRALPEGAHYWRSAPIGRLRDPVLRVLSVQNVTEVILATDGAMLSVDHLDALDTALEQVSGRQLSAGLPKVRDDVAAIRCRRR
jgi:hypothetical protein